MAATELLISSFWSRALSGLQRRVTRSIQNAESLSLSGGFAIPRPQALPTWQPKWVLKRIFSTRGARAAERSLWVDDDDDDTSREQAPPRGLRAGRTASFDNDNGSAFRPSGGPKRTSTSWESSGQDDGRMGEFDSDRRPSQGGYIDEWGQVEDNVDEPGSRSSSGPGVSYGSQKRFGGKPSRYSNSKEREWEGEWGEYLERVEKRRPRQDFNQGREEEDSTVDGYGRQRRGSSEGQWFDSSVDRSSGGGGRGSRYWERAGDQRGSTAGPRSGISKYNDRGRGGREQQSGRNVAWDRNDRSASQSGGGGGAMDSSTQFQARNSPPERRSEGEGGRRRQDLRRDRSWGDDEGGPLVKGGIELNGEVLYGVMPVQAAIRARRRELYTLYVQENLRSRKKGDKAAVERIKREAQAAGAVLQEASKHTLNLLADNRPHQGFVLDAAPLRFVALDELPPPPSSPIPAAPLWVALDEVVDPQNFGAVLRSAYFLGAAGVLTCARNSSPLTAVVSKASAGAAESMEVFSCDHMPTALAVAVQDGWRVLGASADQSAPLVTELPRGVPTVIVLGNEGVGLRTNVRRACSGFVRIAGQGTPFPIVFTETDTSRGDEDNDVSDNESAEESDDEIPDGAREGTPGPSAAFAVDSLNVSVAAGILMHELLAPRPTSTPLLQAEEAGDGVEEQSDDALSKLLTSQTA